MKLFGTRKAIHTPEFHKKKQRENRIRTSSITLLVLVVIVGPILLLRNKHLLISKVEIKGNIVTKTEELHSVVQGNLSGNYLWVIPRSSILFYPKSKIKTDLLKFEPRLSMVEENIAEGSSLRISVLERTPSSMYCNDVANLSAPEGCYFLDASGFIFSVAPAFSGGVYFVYSSEPLRENPLSTNYLEPLKFKAVDRFVKDVTDAGLSPKVFIIKNDEYHMMLSSGTVVIWKSEKDLDQVLSSLTSLVQDPSFKKDPNNLNKILYIDMRFGNKIFYKYRDGL